MTNTEALNDIIEKSGLKKKYIAERLGLSSYGMQRKIENVNEFKSTEIAALCKLLGINSLEQKERIFFANSVD